MESKGESSAGSNKKLLPNAVNPNTRITPSLFNGINCKDWAYSARMVSKVRRDLAIFDGSIKEPEKNDPKYSNWILENILVMNWILNSMKGQ